MVSKIRLSRAQLERIVGNDPDAIRQFEKLFAASSLSETSLQDVALSAAVAETRAGEAIDAINRLADAIELHPLALPAVSGDDPGPVGQVGQSWDDLAPVPQVHTKRSGYGWFSSTVDQTAAAINTAYAMTFNTTGEAQDVRIGSPASRIYIERQGVYNIQFSAQLLNTGGSAHRAWIWLAINGAAVADSSTVLRVQGNNTELVAAWNFVARLKAGDYFELMWEVDDTGISLFADPATAVHPAIPSVLLSVTDNISE